MSDRSTASPNAEPMTPQLETQRAITDDADGLAGLVRWRYYLRYLHEHAPQDEVDIALNFNLRPPEATTPATDDAPAQTEYRYVARVRHSADRENIEALLLRRVGEAPWPSADCHVFEEDPIDLGGGTGEGAERCYALDPPLAVGSWLRIGLSWDGLDLLTAQSVLVSLAARRDPAPAAAQHDAPVVQGTAVVVGPLLKPLNRWPEEIDIDDQGETLAAALDAVFVALFGERRIGQPVALQFSYGYAIRPDGGEAGPFAYVPALLHAVQPLAATTASQAAAALDDWLQQTDPPRRAGRWSLTLTQFSQVDPDAREPLLGLSRLIYRLR